MVSERVNGGGIVHDCFYWVTDCSWDVFDVWQTADFCDDVASFDGCRFVDRDWVVDAVLGCDFLAALGIKEKQILVFAVLVLFSAIRFFNLLKARHGG